MPPQALLLRHQSCQNNRHTDVCLHSVLLPHRCVRAGQRGGIYLVQLFLLRLLDPDRKQLLQRHHLQRQGPPLQEGCEPALSAGPVTPPQRQELITDVWIFKRNIHTHAWTF